MTKQLTFEEIRQYIKDERYDVYTRNDDYKKAYEIHKINMKSKYASIKDMVLINFLNYSKTITSNLKIESKKDDSWLEYKLCENTFPYSIDKNILHNVLWSINDLPDGRIRNILNQTVTNEYIYFRNPPQCRSIPSVFHVHVFIKLS